MPQFLLESPHTKEECLRALDELVDKEPTLLKESWFGCMSGDHTEYATIEASNESEVRGMLPEFLREKARVVEVTKITPEEVRRFHM
ncbi:MAG: hypothetical protein Q7T82_15215 [Armatimonadota bacterium]|nr:hypothetical protein [Armatimonadota bacterium]